MRAMPSPHDSTRPVSRTSISRPYSAIWRLMTSLISAGRISMFDVSSCLSDRRSLAYSAGGSGELFGETGELRAHAAVVDLAFGLDHDAAE